MPETTTKYPRLYIDNKLIADSVIAADNQHYHYLMNVLRFKSKDKVRLFNERDGEFLAEVEQTNKKAIAFNVLSLIRKPLLCHELHLFFAPLKRVAMDFVIEKGTELGVTHFRPVITDFTQKTHFKADKYRQTAIEAAEQCERFDVPEIFEPMPLIKVLDSYEGKIMWADEELGRHEVEVLPLAMAQCKAILIGPEGGFSENERTCLRRHDKIEACSLGPRILRAETATLAMLAMHLIREKKGN